MRIDRERAPKVPPTAARPSREHLGIELRRPGREPAEGGRRQGHGGQQRRPDLVGQRGQVGRREGPQVLRAADPSEQAAGRGHSEVAARMDSLSDPMVARTAEGS